MERTGRARTHNLSKRSHASNYTQIYTGLGWWLWSALSIVCVWFRSRARTRHTEEKEENRRKSKGKKNAHWNQYGTDTHRIYSRKNARQCWTRECDCFFLLFGLLLSRFRYACTHFVSVTQTYTYTHTCIHRQKPSQYATESTTKSVRLFTYVFLSMFICLVFCFIPIWKSTIELHSWHNGVNRIFCLPLYRRRKAPVCVYVFRLNSKSSHIFRIFPDPYMYWLYFNFHFENYILK